MIFIIVLWNTIMNGEFRPRVFEAPNSKCAGTKTPAVTAYRKYGSDLSFIIIGLEIIK